MKIAQSKTREQFPLSYRKIIKKTLSRTFFFIILFLIFGGFAILMSTYAAVSNKEFSIWLPMLISLGLLFLVMLLTYLYQRWYFAVYFYDLTPDYIQIRKGPITPREITIPYERIQDVYVDQDLLDRMFGLYDVHLSSATVSSGMAAHIDGVERQAAEGLRAVLLETIKQRISKNRTINPPTTNPTS